MPGAAYASAEDHWAPLELSELILPRITNVPVEMVLLDRAGHYPLEEPGLTQMQEAIDEFVKEVTDTNPSVPGN